MTGDTDSADASIATKTARLEAIIEQLEEGDVSLERAQELRAEGEDLLTALEDDLDVGDGAVTDRS